MSAGELDPRRNVAFFLDLSKELKGYARALERGGTPTNPLPTLDEALDKLQLLKHLEEFYRVSRASANAASLGIDPDQVYAQWRMAFVSQGIDISDLLEHAKDVSAEKVDAAVANVRSKQAEVDRAERALATVPKLDLDRQSQALDAQGEAFENFRTAFRALQQLIGPPGEPFDPQHRYKDDWAALAGAQLRGLDANGPAIMASRNARGWSRRQLAKAIGKRTGKPPSTRTIQRLEDGARVDVKTLEAVADALGEAVSAIALWQPEEGHAKD